MRRVLVFTDSVSFGYDVISSLKEAGQLHEVYVQLSHVQYRLGRYLKGLPRFSVIKRRMVDVVDRLNRPYRRMSVDATDTILQEVGAVPFIQFNEIRPLVNAKDATVVVYGTRIALP